jgi:hypothetical protein
MDIVETIVLDFLAVIGGIAIVAICMLIAAKKAGRKPEIPGNLFEDCRGDLRQLQDWYFSQGLYKDMEKTTKMLKELDSLWAEHDMTIQSHEHLD